MRTLPEVLITPRGDDDFVALNPFTRTYAVCDTAFVALLGALRSSEDVARFADARFRVADATVSPYADGLLGDPTGLDRDRSARDAEPVDLEAALALARALWLVGDEDALSEHLGPRRNVLDRGKRGTIHQRVGDHVLFDLRQRDVDAWWADQKFAAGRREPAEGPYRWVQWDALRPWAAEQDLDGADVLDFGCGPGLFARLFARQGARVLAVDTNEQHLETARALAAEDGVAIETRTLTLPAEDALPADRAFDLIFLSDVLMFYFVPYDASAGLDPAALLRALRARLKPGGRIVVTEPNGIFWQRAWLGAPDRPFTVLTEYRTHRDTVTPTLEELSRAAEAADLAIRSVRELVPSDDGAPDDRARRYAAEFPLWWLIELVAL
jgi:2-polyprenyl-3-methyl-5-hydroxy-6-metoxy-1,4-benzoquinol methylase